MHIEVSRTVDRWLRHTRRARALFRGVGAAILFLIAVLVTVPFTYDDAAHARLDAGVAQWLPWGDQVLGFEFTLPRQNIFSLVRDVRRAVVVIDHGTAMQSRMLGVSLFISRGAIATVADALRWFDIPLTRVQAQHVRLCKRLDALQAHEAIVIAADPWQYGIASWYGPGFHGRLAASGEIYNMYDRTAAHKTLPLQSLVRVVAQRSGQSVVVRINDRGPYVGGRIIDLSQYAKQLLGAGDLAQVYLERIDPGALDAYCE